MGPSAELLDLVVAVARELPASTVLAFADGLDVAPAWTRDGRPVIEASGAAPWQALWKVAVASPWCTAPRLAALLRGAVATDEAWRRSVELEVAWTGPAPPLSSLRRTEQALLEVIETARRDLWVVSFAAHRIASICGGLVRAGRRGCRVRLLLESEIESQGALSSGGVDDMPADVRAACELYVWPLEKRPMNRGRPATLHAKCAVADGELLFVGSANLTEFALEWNIELGVLARHQEAARVIERQLRWLVESGTMARLGM